MSETSLTVLNLYELTGTAEEFKAAIARLAARVGDEGHPGILSYRFFVNPAENSARAVIDYESPAAWIGHHDLAMAWPETADLHAVAELTEVTFLGPLTSEIESWIASSTLTARILDGNSFAAGFQRRIPN
jgi:hypothetical protein